MFGVWLAVHMITTYNRTDGMACNSYDSYLVLLLIELCLRDSKHIMKLNFEIYFNYYKHMNMKKSCELFPLWFPYRTPHVRLRSLLEL